MLRIRAMSRKQGRRRLRVETDAALRGFFSWFHERTQRDEHGLEPCAHPSDKLLARLQAAAQAHEGTDDFDVDLKGALAPEDA
jgi:hypothetical protein